jgi:D-beta-D-heptose 7-phosphate kinase/D-beta-D-heptose 1-phosphate adenosyltransferase
MATLREAVDKIAGCRAVVVGDVMVDEYLCGEVSRVSPEAPVPVLEPRATEYRLGGAANTAANVRALGGSVTLVGVVGRDDAAQVLVDRLRDRGIAPELVVDADRPTTLKTRVVAQQQQIVRIDREARHPISGTVAEDLRRRIDLALPAAHVLVLSDYAKGVVTSEVAKHAIAAARGVKIPIVVDPKQLDFRVYAGATVLTPNLRELGAAAPDMSVDAASEHLLSQLGGAAVLVTRGADGMTLFRSDHAPIHVTAAAKEVFDVTGAGDTVVAALALALAAGVTLEQAVELANFAAALAVGKRGTSSITAAELAAVLPS